MADFHTVVKGDTLSQIAVTYGVTVEKLVELNNITDPDYIVVGQVIRLSGVSNSEPYVFLKPVIKVIGIQSNTDSTVYVTWNWYRDYVENYKVLWEYDTGDGVWFIGNESTTEHKQCTYNAPSNAKRVRFKVKAISQKHKVNGVEVFYWVSGWSTASEYSFSSNPPKTPPTPTVEIDKYTLTAKLDNLDVNATKIQFQVVINDAHVFKSGTASIRTNSASYSCTVDLGNEYKVRCRSCSGNKYSDWSDYTSNISTIPSSPTKITTCKATSKTSVYLKWSSVKTADSYEIQYTTNKNYFDASDQVNSVTGILFNYYEKSGLESGNEYFFRVRAVNDKGNSTWSDIKSVVIGTTPAVPTTWSSTTTAVVGEDLILYWMHNSEDGSDETFAELELYIDGVLRTPNEIIKNETSDDEDEEDQNSSFTIDTSAYSEGCTIQWRVRTAGITKEYGDWSTQRTVDIYAPPTLAFSINNSSGESLDIVESFPIYARGLAGPNTQVPISYHLSITSNDIYETVDNVGNTKIVNAGESVYSKHFDTSEDLLVELSPSNIDLENNISYTATCTVSMNSGLTAESTHDFEVSWTDEQYPPNAEIGIETDTFTASIRPYCVDENEELIEGIRLSVYRREYDGTFTELATGINNTSNIYITDPHPALDYARYRIVATTESTGSVSYYDVPGYPVGGKAVIIQWEEQWSSFDTVNEDTLEQPAWAGSMLKLPYNVDISDSHSPDVSLVEYIGREHPVSYYGTHRGVTSTWSVSIEKDDEETLYSLRRLARWMNDVYVREPSGSGYWANVTVSFSQKHCDLIIPVTLNITRVEGGV